jgi:zinc transport system substrate-binding protein
MSLGIPTPLAMLFGIVMAALFSLVLSAPSLRVSGDYLVISSIGFQLGLLQIIKNLEWTGGAGGLSGIPPLLSSYSVGNIITYWVIIWSCAALVVFTIKMLTRGAYGRAITAMRDDEDKENAAKYAANADRAVAALKALDADLRKQLAPLKGKRFIVSHDQLQYLEMRYGLAAAGSIAISPDRPPSARRLYQIRSRILANKVVCVFGEPQVPDSLVKTVVEGTKARTGAIDTDGGIAVPEGKDAYATIMRAVGKALVDCLGAG